MVPLVVCPQALGAEVQELPYPAGAGFGAHAFNGQLALAGGVEEHEPSHWMVPLDRVWPQALGAEVQEEPALAAQAQFGVVKGVLSLYTENQS